VSDWLSEEENGPWLMVLDNADDADVWVTAPEGPLVNYLPRGKHGSMLVTTRNSQLGKTITKAKKKPIDVPIFGSDDSVALLRSKVSEDDELTIEDSKEITSILCHLPLAITQAAAYLDQNEISVAEYLALLKSSKADTVDLLVRESHDESRDPDIQNSVFHTWKISFDQISRQNPRAASVLSTMAQLDRQSISMDLLREEGEAELDIREAMQKLKSFSLVTEETKEKTFSMHRIVQLSIQWYLKSQESLESWQEKALICVDSCYFESKDLRLIETLLPHIQLVLSYNYTTGACKIHLANLLYKIGGYNFRLGRWRLAVQYGEECLKLRETICGPARKETIQTMTELAHGLIISGSRRNHDRAEKLLRRALVLSETDFPDLHTHSLRRLASLLLVQGKFTESEELFQQVLKIVREQDGADSDDAMYTIALIMYESTFVYEAQDRHEEAENVQRKVLEIFKARGDRDTELAMCMKRLAQILSFRHKHTEELELRREILSIWTELLGPIHPGTLVERNPLAQCLTNCGDLEEAEEILRELLEIRTQTLGADHKDTLKTLRNLARVLNKMDKCDEAEGIQQDALVRCTNALGPEHKLTLSIMYDLGKNTVLR
jgi:tetratricopeptide (TPR) repeat protein